MASTFTTRLRLVKQGTGDNLNTWGTILNESALEMVDDAIAGMTSFTLSGSKTLSTVNGTPDEARRAFLNVTGGTGGTITIPSLSKVYQVRNASTGAVIITTGGGSTATIPTGQSLAVTCDGTNVYASILTDYSGSVIKGVGTPLTATDAVNKSYADGILVEANAYTDQVANQSGNLPNQTGTPNRILKTDGESASWTEMSDIGIVLTANNLSDLSNVSTARTNLGLGGAAVLSVGTVAGTVAAGDDSRITGAAQKSQNLADLVSASSARSNLGLGTAATRADSYFARTANNLSDLASASTARSNLGLGTSATQPSTAFLQTANNLSDLASVATALTNLGLTGNVGTSGTMRIPQNVSGSNIVFMVKWITQSVTGGTTWNLNWPNGAFPNACMFAGSHWMSSSASGDRAPRIYNYSASGASVVNDGNTATVGAWAIGY